MSIRNLSPAHQHANVRDTRIDLQLLVLELERIENDKSASRTIPDALLSGLQNCLSDLRLLSGRNPITGAKTK
jgi:hypothetical protein